MFEQLIAPLATSQGLIALVMLTLMEVVLGIDNIIFISILISTRFLSLSVTKEGHHSHTNTHSHKRWLMCL